MYYQTIVLKILYTLCLLFLPLHQQNFFLYELHMMLHLLLQSMKY